MRKCRFCQEEISAASVVCEHCGRELVARAVTAVAAPTPQPAAVKEIARETTGARDGAPSGAAKVFWLISLMAAVAAGGMGVLTITTATGAPQEAAGAAIACLIAIVPYVFARGIDELTRG